MSIIDNYFNKYACNTIDLDYILIQRINNNIENNKTEVLENTNNENNKIEVLENNKTEVLEDTNNENNKTEVLEDTNNENNKTEVLEDTNIDISKNMIKINKILSYNNTNLLNENIRLKNENSELLQMLNQVIKTEYDNKDYHKIKVKIISKINRDLRTKNIFPFNNLLSL
jgi:hypothetical protein